MRNWVWIVVVMVITLIIINLFNIPLWIFTILVAPLLTIALTYISFSYSFKPSLKPEPIPASGYGSRIGDLERQAMIVGPLQFYKYDTFYLKTIPDAVVYVFKNITEPSYLCIYHFGSKMSCDYITFCENGFSLTTTSNVNGGMFPRLPGKLLQIFENLPYDRLFAEHMRGVVFLYNQGINRIDLPPDLFRVYFMDAIRRSTNYVRTFAFWPIRLVYWTITKRGKVHLKSIEEQLRSGMIKIRFS